MLQGDKLIASHEKIASPPSPIQHFNVITVGTQSALKPFLEQPHLGAASRKNLDQTTHSPLLYPQQCKRQAEQQSNWDNEGILSFHLKCWQMRHRWLRAAIHASTVMVCVKALQLLCSILSAQPPGPHVTALHTLLNSSCSNHWSCKVRLPS